MLVTTQWPLKRAATSTHLSGFVFYGCLESLTELSALWHHFHYGDIMMGTIASQITSLTIVYSTVYSDADQKKKKCRVTGLCAGNSPGTGGFPAQMASNAENVSIWWRHHVKAKAWYMLHLYCVEFHVIFSCVMMGLGCCTMSYVVH